MGIMTILMAMMMTMMTMMMTMSMSMAITVIIMSILGLVEKEYGYIIETPQLSKNTESLVCTASQHFFAIDSFVFLLSRHVEVFLCERFKAWILPHTQNPNNLRCYRQRSLGWETWSADRAVR